MLGLDRESSIWFGIYFPISWSTQFGHGLVTTVVGPTQPYLAKNTGTSIDTINFVWTFGFFGFLLGSLLTGLIFKQYLKTARAKLVFLASTICITGIFMIALPFTSSFALLVTFRLIQFLALGGFITGDASLIIYLIGPIKARPFTMMIHAVIGAGFLAATFLVQPFLPSENETDKDELCNRRSESLGLYNLTTMPINENDSDGTQVIPTIAWPFIISGGWCIVFSFGFLVLACLPYKMPNFYNQQQDSESEEKFEEKRMRYQPLFLVLVFLYYFVACGIERIYQPMASTFGLCGPLDLSPREAVATDSFYNGGFMCGRLVSAAVASLILPRNMIVVSVLACVAGAGLLCALAGTNVYGLYAGTAILGFFVSWQFGSCFSWVAAKIDVTGRLSSLFFIGCGAGSLCTPPLAGYIFTSSLGPMSIIYLTLGFCILQCLLFSTMWALSRSTTKLS